MTAATHRPHVFVSYKSEDRDRAEQVVIGLRSRGLAVWWDQSLEAGDRFTEEITAHVHAAWVVLVLWSSGAVGSEWVEAEANIGRLAKKLVPVRVDECAPPLAFQVLQTADLIGWVGDFSDPRWVKLAETVQAKAEARSASAGEPVARQHVDALVPYRTRLEARLNVVPRVFRHFGPHSVTDVFVEVRLSGERVLDPEAAFPDVPGSSRASVLEPGAKIRIDEVLDRPERLWALLGPPGSGKTTLLHRLAIDLLQRPERHRLPVLLRAADLRPGDALESRLRASEEGAKDADLLLREIGGGRAVILIDGLDEHAEPGSDALKDVLVSIAAEAPGCKVILTSRPIGYDPPSAQFHRLDLCALEREAQRELLSRWVTEPARVERSLAQLQRSAALRRLAENPLLLTLVGIVLFDPDVELPTHRSMLYEQAVSTLIRGAHAEGRPTLQHPELARGALEDLALVLHANEQPEVKLAQALTALGGSPAAAEVAAKWGSGERFLADVARRTGLLLPYPNAFRVQGYLAPHRSLREYLAACALKRRPGAVQKVVTRATERPATWAEVLALLCGLQDLEEADALVQRVIATGSQELALRVVADAERIKPDTVYAALRVEAGQENWKPRVKVLREDLPRLVSDTAEPARRVMDLLRRFAETTTHGADLFWCERLLERLGRGLCEGLEVPQDVRKDAAGLAGRMWLAHRPEERKDVLAELERWGWCAVPRGYHWVGDDAKQRVELVEGFEALAVPVTNGLYERFDPGHAADRPWKDGDDFPVVNVTWYEAMAFAQWLAAEPGGRVVRLPVEVEWEAAARGSTRTAYWSGDSEADLARVGWYNENSGDRTHRVAEKGQPNPYGLHDVHGNVWEWCADPSAATRPSRHDPRAVSLDLDSAVGRMFRGGSWYFDADFARSDFRDWWDPGSRYRSQGLRLVRLLVPQAGSGGRR
jgi:Sulfatase-modifying factor enzyme 1/TIR domain/NACHT domain